MQNCLAVIIRNIIPYFNHNISVGRFFHKNRRWWSRTISISADSKNEEEDHRKTKFFAMHFLFIFFYQNTNINLLSCIFMYILNISFRFYKNILLILNFSALPNYLFFSFFCLFNQKILCILVFYHPDSVVNISIFHIVMETQKINKT